MEFSRDSVSLEHPTEKQSGWERANEAFLILFELLPRGFRRGKRLRAISGWAILTFAGP